MTRRHRFSAALSVVILVCASGCVGSAAPTTPAPSTEPPRGSPSEPVANSSDTPAATSPNETPTPRGTSASPASADTVLDATLAVIRAGSVHYEVETRYNSATIRNARTTGRGYVSFGEPRQFRVMNDADPRIDKPATEVIVDDKLVYIREDGAASLPPGTWVVYEPHPDSLFWDLVVRNYGDPRLIIAPLLGAIGVDEGGTETIRGQSASRLKTDIDPDLALKRLPTNLVAPFERHLQEVRRSDSDFWLDMEVWIGSDGRLFRMQFDVPIPGGQASNLVVTYDFSGIGEPITVAPDPDDPVLTIEEAQARYRDFIRTAPPSAP